MNDLVPFAFNSHPVRVIERDGQPWFILADVCAVLEIANVGNAAARLDDDEKDTIRDPDSNGVGNPHKTIINESGVYKLVMRSRKAEAKAFVKFLTSDLLPKWRRGELGHVAKPALDWRDPYALQAALAEHLDGRIAAEERAERLEPKAAALDRITDAQGMMCVTDAAKVLGVPPRRLSAWMEAHKWVYRRFDGGDLIARGEKLESKMLDHKGVTIPVRGRPDKWKQQVMVTAKGLARLAELKAGQ